MLQELVVKSAEKEMDKAIGDANYDDKKKRYENVVSGYNLDKNIDTYLVETTKKLAQKRY